MSLPSSFDEILVVDDERPILEFLAQTLESDGYRVTALTSGTKALEILQDKYFAVAILDIQLKDIDGMQLFKKIAERHPNTSVIFLTGRGCIDTAVTAMREGAFDYLSKSLDLSSIEVELKTKIKRAFKNSRALVGNGDGHEFIPKVETGMFIGKSLPAVSLYKLIGKAAASDINVLISGETGSGKELVARSIHENSKRHNRPMVTVNCCALTESLLESELFGHIRGSFTGATGNKTGLFEEADGGTIFLDEIGDITPLMQVKLLRVLQEGEIKPVGASEVRSVNVRVLSATHRDLAALVSEGTFREDLYYRLRVLEIEVPPLRDRTDDIPELVYLFCSRSMKKNDKVVTSVSDEAMSLLQNYSWPGNIRELENAIDRAVAMTSSSILYPEDLPPQILVAEAAESASAPDRTSENGSLEDLERQHILKILENNNFNKSKTAETLGIDRVTLYRKASRYGISLKKPDTQRVV